MSFLESPDHKRKTMLLKDTKEPLFATHYYVAGKIPKSSEKSQIGRLSRESSASWISKTK